jgi:hypothetical protein
VLLTDASAALTAPSAALLRARCHELLLKHMPAFASAVRTGGQSLARVCRVVEVRLYCNTLTWWRCDYTLTH